MKKKDPLDDLELFINPKPLTKEEQVNLSAFIRKLKANSKKQLVQHSADRKPGSHTKSKLEVSNKP